MSLQNTPRLGLPLLQSGQTGAYITLNETIWKLEALVQATALSRSVTTQPSDPQAGDAYILPEAATGAVWDDHEAGDFLIFWGGYWNVVTQGEGAIVYVADEATHLVRKDAGWGALTVQQNLSSVGINATSDDYNRLSVSSPAVLFNHAGNGIQTKLNKNAAGDTASLLWQTGWSGRAEFGTNGSDNLSLKVSPDGNRWLTAYEVNRFSGRIRWSRGGYQRPDAVKRRRVNSSSWLSSTGVANNNWRAVCWSEALGLFCAVADSGTGSRVMTSSDGVNWILRTSADIDWASVCWADEAGLFCAVAASGTGNRVMTSPNGVDWTAQAGAPDNNWRSVCWAAELGLFCAVSDSGTGNRVMTSSDGINWTVCASAVDNGWRSVCWAAELGLFCAVAVSGSGNRVMTSPDGSNWTVRASAADNGWRSVCWAAERGLFCAVAETGARRVMISSDGINWTTQAAVDNGWRSVCWSPQLGQFCAVATSGTGNRVMTSSEGIDWVVRVSAADNGWDSVCWSSELGLFCAVGWSGTGNRVMTSVSAHSFPYRS
ncbi:MAG: DUF2793 domain-containing protein [Asticcacaulis sp.]